MNKLRECREKAKLSQKQVAFEVGVKPPTVSQWESGIKKPSRDNIVKLASIYGVTVDYLMGLDEKKPATGGDGLRDDVVNLLLDLPPDDLQEMRNYAAYLKSRRGKE
ncbi:MAG: helix-turn-helix transcriptional regulator [Clostridia bacterium]|nr:helix-turn-helix transcriptional regulator [Clostridia bacterium]